MRNESIVIDFFIDQGQGASFDAPYEVLGVGKHAAHAYLDEESEKKAIEFQEMFKGEIVVYMQRFRLD